MVPYLHQFSAEVQKMPFFGYSSDIIHICYQQQSIKTSTIFNAHFSWVYLKDAGPESKVMEPNLWFQKNSQIQIKYINLYLTNVYYIIFIIFYIIRNHGQAFMYYQQANNLYTKLE